MPDVKAVINNFKSTVLPILNSKSDSKSSNTTKPMVNPIQKNTTIINSTTQINAQQNKTKPAVVIATKPAVVNVTKPVVTNATKPAVANLTSNST